MSSVSLVEGPNGVLAAWETDGQIYFGKVDSGGVTEVRAAGGEGRDRKHPALAVNFKGEILLAWTEGTGWQRGGSLAWQVYSVNGTRASKSGGIPDGIPRWGLPTATARKDGSFLIVY